MVSVKSDTLYNIGLLVLAVPGYLASGWAVSTLWNWFVPLPPLTLATGIGISLLASYLTVSGSDILQRHTAEQRFQVSLVMIIYAAMVVGIGWAVRALGGH